MDVTCTAEKDLRDEQAREILELQHAAFPRTEEFRTQRWWHTPAADDDLYFTAHMDGRCVASIRVLSRRIATPNGEVSVAGVGNVCSHPDARGKGAATACMKKVLLHIASAADFGLLFCGADRRGFYTRFGWCEVNNDLWYLDEQGARRRADPNSHGCIMVFPGRRGMEDWPEGPIDLNGPDW